ncbi:MAG: hypothetical protein J6V68_00110 [Clostridia bacterium]|nr:hypothetical protein [Clostridia bacterium]
MQDKTIKDYAKEAKKRLKTGFWQEQKEKAKLRTEKAVLEGVAVSKVTQYNFEEARRKITVDPLFSEEEEFYDKVKSLLDEFGETEDIVGKLIDKEYYNSVSYERRQRYMLSLSDRYLSALERYKKEKALVAII